MQWKLKRPVSKDALTEERKDNPGTLPIQAYAVSTPSIVEPVCMPEENACQNISQSHQDLPIESELPVKLPEVWPTEHEQEFALHKSSKQLVRKKMNQLKMARNW